MLLQAAIRRAVNPSVDACVSRLKALESANQISLLRQRVNDFVALFATDSNKSELQRVANELLHCPTMRLREGEVVELEEIVAGIEDQLKEYLHSEVSLEGHKPFN